MANTSILAAFERMWQHVVTIVSDKSDLDHNHNDVYDAKGSANDALTSAKSYTDTKTSGLASISTVDTKISTHNTSTSAHNDIRDLITGLTNRLNTLADSDDTTLDQMSEIVEYIKANKSLIDSITTSKVNVSDIVNNLTTNVTNKPLSAAQGIAIKSLIDALQTELDSHTHAIADVSGLQSALDGKAASSHGTHVSYSSTAPKMDGAASAGSASTVARTDHVHPTDTSRASQSDLDALESVVAGKVDSLSDLGITATATELNYVDGVTSNVQTQLDTLTSNKVSKTGDTMTGDLTIKANFGSVRFNDADGNKMSVLQANNDSHTTSIYAYPTDKSTYYEKYDFPTPSTGATANKVYKVLTTKDVTATVAELNYIDGVTSNIQTQLNGKASSDHTHSSYVNQNAFSNIAVSGQTTVAADTSTDTVTFAGSNMSITTNATTDTVTFSVANASTSAKGVVQLVDSATNTATDKAATANAVNTAYTLASKANTTANSAKTTAESKSTVEASTTNGKIKIDGTETTVYTHPTTAGNKHIPSGGSSGQVLKYSSSGSATWGTDKDTTYSLNSGDSNGTIKVTPSSGSSYNVAVKGLGSVAYTNTVPVANGGTGATTAAAAKTNLGFLTSSDFTVSNGVLTLNFL